MYSKIKTLQINAGIIKFQTTDMAEPITIYHKEHIEYSDKFFVEQTNTFAVDKSGESFNIRCFKNNIYISNNIDLICKIYVPQKVKYLINKDILNKEDGFSLEYRKHLRTEYSCERHVFLSFNYIPEDYESLVEKARTICKKYSSGVYNQPILCCYFDEDREKLFYAIVKDNISVENGYLSLTPNVWE